MTSGITVVQFLQRKSLMWDTTCCDTFAPSLITTSSPFPGSAATAAEDSKSRKYASLAPGYNIVQFSVESFGEISPSTIALIKEVGHRIVDPEDDSHSTYFLFERTSNVVIQGNSFGILGSGKKGKFS